MKETRVSIMRLLFQVILAILQSVAALGLFVYLLDTSPDFGPTPGGMQVFLLCTIFFLFIHALFRILDGIASWRLAVAKSRQM
ncbi:MAG: hypothetical protein ACXADL_02645 [Candidatus Thorarchaeota archaeon]|jgi:hypothetical protein